jgi:phosphoenolpyruvate-protein phosphotransferase
MNEREVTLTGYGISPGLGEGRTFLHHDELSLRHESEHIDPCQMGEELQRFRCTVDRITCDLDELVHKVKGEISRDLSAVFQAHSEMLQDPDLRTEVEQQITQQLVSTRTAIRNVFLWWEHRMRGSQLEITRQKADDISDLMRRLLRSLTGVETTGLERLPYGSVLVTGPLLPSDIITLANANRRPAAVLTEASTRASHAALLVRELGIPCVGGLGRILEVMEDDAHVIVDADLGRVVMNPARSTLTVFRRRRARRAEALLDARSRAQEPGRTQDGTQVSVLANVACLHDTLNAMENGADGIGLYRTEGIYLRSIEPPDTDALYEQMKRVLDPAKTKPICVRLLDAGGDKPLPYIDGPAEPNPALGSRGIRLLFEHRELLETQLRAVLRLHQELPLSVLVPMVTDPLDMARVAELMRELSVELRVSAVPRLGAMIETPAAALCAKAISRHADFFSVGTNDLTQYALATDRVNSRVCRYFDDTHEAVRRLIRIARDDAPGTTFSVCGEIAGNDTCTSWLLDSGIASLSVVPPLVPLIKESVRRCTVRRRPPANGVRSGSWSVTPLALSPQILSIKKVGEMS